jgi:hypothetical protein
MFCLVLLLTFAEFNSPYFYWNRDATRPSYTVIPRSTKKNCNERRELYNVPIENSTCYILVYIKNINETAVPKPWVSYVQYLTVFPLLQFINFVSWREIQNAVGPYRNRVCCNSLLFCAKTSGQLSGWTTQNFAMPRYVKMVLRRCLKNRLKENKIPWKAEENVTFFVPYLYMYTPLFVVVEIFEKMTAEILCLTLDK